jgi:hypothetical protein
LLIFLVLIHFFFVFFFIIGVHCVYVECHVLVGVCHVHGVHPILNVHCVPNVHMFVMILMFVVFIIHLFIIFLMIVRIMVFLYSSRSWCLFTLCDLCAHLLIIFVMIMFSSQFQCSLHFLCLTIFHDHGVCHISNSFICLVFGAHHVFDVCQFPNVNFDAFPNYLIDSNVN